MPPGQCANETGFRLPHRRRTLQRLQGIREIFSRSKRLAGVASGHAQLDSNSVTLRTDRAIATRVPRGWWVSPCPAPVFTALFHDRHDDPDLESMLRDIDLGEVRWERGRERSGVVAAAGVGGPGVPGGR